MAKTTVIIPAINDPYLHRTVKSVRENAGGEVEFILINDGGKMIVSKDTDTLVINQYKMVGRRVSINEAALKATGDYLFILDSHCSMSKDWDIKMQESCRDLNLVYTVIRDMEPDTWEYRAGDYLHVRLNKEYTEKWWPKKTLAECDVEEESMAITGCAWMVTKKRYWQLGGYNEALGEYGWDGPEWACKVWMGENPGKVILRTDVICGHIFGTNNGGKLYPCKMIPKSQYVAYMEKKWGDKIGGLVEYFAPVPGWATEEKGAAIGQNREVKIARNVTHTTRRDSDNKIIKKVIEHYEYIYKDRGEGPSEEEITKQYGDKVKKVGETVWVLNDVGRLVLQTEMDRQKLNEPLGETLADSTPKLKEAVK